MSDPIPAELVERMQEHAKWCAENVRLMCLGVYSDKELADFLAGRLARAFLDGQREQAEEDAIMMEQPQSWGLGVNPSSEVRAAAIRRVATERREGDK